MICEDCDKESSIGVEAVICPYMKAVYGVDNVVVLCDDCYSMRLVRT